MNVLFNFLVVGLAGSAGAMARYLVAMLANRWMGDSFPFGTFIINITGSFFLGWFYSFSQGRVAISDATRLAVAVGFTGAFTTFSTLMYESDSLLRDGAAIKAMVNLLGSLVIGLAAVRLGVALGKGAGI